jgi:hypothetical protein
MHTKELAAVLRRAASLVGGPDVLAARLGTSEQHMKRWISGVADAPTFVFLGAVDIIATHNASEARTSRTDTGQGDDRPDQRAD